MIIGSKALWLCKRPLTSEQRAVRLRLEDDRCPLYRHERPTLHGQLPRLVRQKPLHLIFLHPGGQTSPRFNTPDLMRDRCLTGSPLAVLEFTHDSTTFNTNALTSPPTASRIHEATLVTRTPSSAVHLKDDLRVEFCDSSGSTRFSPAATANAPALKGRRPAQMADCPQQ